MQPSFSGPLKRVAWLVGLLITSLVAAGVLQLVFVLQMDQRFRVVVNDLVPEINRGQAITLAVSEVHRQMLNGLLTDVTEEREISLEKSRQAVVVVDSIWEKVPGWTEAPETPLGRVREAWEAYRHTHAEMMAAAARGQRAEALGLRRLRLRPQYDRLQAELQLWTSQSADSARGAYQGARDELARSQMILLILCGWPLAVALVGLFVLICFWVWASRQVPDESGVLSRD